MARRPSPDVAWRGLPQPLWRFVDGRGGSLERNFIRDGFGLFSDQERNRWEIQARLQNIIGPHTLKYGFEYNENIYKIDTVSTGPAVVSTNPTGR